MFLSLYIYENNGGVGLAVALHYKMTLRLWKEEKVFGPGILSLMQLIDRLGSLQKAAAEVGLAYSKAWKIIKTAEHTLGFALIERSIGGKNGGGSTLTCRGRALMEQYLAFEQDAQEAVTMLFQKYFGGEEENEGRNTVL